MLRFLLLFITFTNACICSEQQPKICLTMIVKNESKIIERCLSSVKDIIDYVSICDTGSTDDTIAIVEAYLKKMEIPGKVHRHAWKNFGHNRTLSVDEAKKMLLEMGASLPNTYLLLLDADMVLKVDPQFSRHCLQDDSYLLCQTYGGLSYYNTRLIRASLPWAVKGVTHEYWACDVPHQRTCLNSLSIDDREDGGSKSDKFERDLKLLIEGLKEEPGNERYMFYCAQTHKCLKQYPDAIRWYKNRIEKGGWKEEVWFSKYMIGECYEEMGFWDHALHWFMEAYQFNPERAEPLKKISSHYRANGQNELACLFAMHGLKIPYPKGQWLFISDPVYEYQFDEDISISAYYTKFKREGFAAINRLLLKKGIPHYVKDQAFKNMLFYVQNLEKANFIPISIELPLLREGSEERYYAMNPTIQKVEDGYLLICRAVNFSQNGGKEYRSRDPADNVIRTRNFLVKMDQNFAVQSQQEIIEDLPRDRVETMVQGLEDCRLFLFKDAYWFLASTYDVSPGNVVQILCQVEKNPNKGALLVKSLQPLKVPVESRCEKNWLPFVKEDELNVIYSYDPLRIFKVDVTTGDCMEVLNQIQGRDFSKFRGSAAPIVFNDGYLILIHEVIFTDQRVYTHRFAYLNKNFEIQKLSKPFTFKHTGIEYCCGMTLDHEEKNCILTVGIEDREACLCIIDVDTIHGLLE